MNVILLKLSTLFDVEVIGDSKYFIRFSSLFTFNFYSKILFNYLLFEEQFFYRSLLTCFWN
jgi:hypothetical protein